MKAPRRRFRYEIRERQIDGENWHCLVDRRDKKTIHKSRCRYDVVQYRDDMIEGNDPHTRLNYMACSHPWGLA